MRRILLFLTVLYITGLLIGTEFISAPLFFLLTASFLGLISIYLYIKRRKVYYIIYMCILLLGIYAFSSRYEKLYEISKRYDTKYISVTGQISQDAVKNGNVITYTLYVDSVEIEGKRFNENCKIKVVDYKNMDKYVIPYNYVRISGVFESIGQYNNTLMPKYLDNLFKKGICGSLIAEYSADLKSFSCTKRWFEKTAYEIKSKAEDKISVYVNKNSSALLEGVIFGDTSGIDDDEYESYKKAGIVHIFAVSGYNIWLIYSLIYYSLFFLKKYKNIRILTVIFFLFLYTVLSGWTASVLRAYIMLSIILFGRILKRNTDTLTSLSLAAFIILLINPLSITDVGFQLSFISVLSIILLYPKFKEISVPLPQKIKEAANVSASVQLGILPVIMYYFNSIPVLSIISNIILMPIVSLFMIMSVILIITGFIMPFFSQVFGIIINTLGTLITWMSNFISSIPFSNINTISPNLFDIVIYYIMLAILFNIISLRKRIKTLILYILIMFMAVNLIINIFPGKLKISFIDIGQGDSILVHTPDHKYILIDGGGKIQTKYSSFDVGEEILKPYLLKHGIKKIDMVVSTHSHDDHLLGLIPVLKNFNVDKFVKSDAGNHEAYNALIKSDIIDERQITDVKKGDYIEIGKYVKLYVLNPFMKMQDENASSIVLKLVYKDFSILLTGDAESSVIKQIDHDFLKSDVLKVSHHGSFSSVDEELLDIIKPKAAVICVGKNSFGHPSQEVLDSIKQKGIKLFRTDKDGEVIIMTNGREISIKTAL